MFKSGERCVCLLKQGAVLFACLGVFSVLGADATKGQDTESTESQGQKIPAVGDAGEGESKIVSDKVDINFADHIAFFEGDVKVFGEKQTLEAEKMRVHFTKNNELKKVIAMDDVVIVQPAKDRRAEGGRAEYDVATGKVVLTEDPSLRLGDSRIENAAKIIYHRDTEQVISKRGSDKERPNVFFRSPEESNLVDGESDEQSGDQQNEEE